jgi:hypothetical protein
LLFEVSSKIIGYGQSQLVKLLKSTPPFFGASGVPKNLTEAQIFGKPDVEGFSHNLALEDIDVKDSELFLFRLACRQHGDVGPPSFHYGAAVFALHCVASEDWYARRGSNSQPSAPEADALSN